MDSVSMLIGAPVVSVKPDATLHEVADAMAAASVGAVVLETDPGQALGIVSERDLMRALADRRDPAIAVAKDIANTALVWCDVEATVLEVAEQMMDSYVRHVLVEDDGRLVGVVSARDILGAYVAADENGE